jgi:competence protein ComEC
VAAGAWLSALAALYAGTRLAVVVLAAAAALAAAAGGVLARRDRVGADRAGGVPPGRDRVGVDSANARRGWGWVAVAALLGVVCGSAATAARLTARDAEPLAGLVRRQAVVRVEIVVRDDPRQVGGWAGRPTYAVPADLVRLTPSGGAVGDGVAGSGGAGRVDGDGMPVRLAARVLILGGDPAWRSLLPGQRALVSGRLLPSRGGDLRAAALSTSDAPALLGSPGWAQRAAGVLRAGLRRACDPLPDEPGGLLPGLVVGDTSRLDPAVEEDFRATGLTHLVAVSGANVAIVVGLVLLLARWVRAGPRLSAAACGVALLGFVILARPSPSVVRAGAMGAIALLALASGRPRAAVPALGATVTVLVCHDPELAGHPGFALSVLATAGLLLLAPRWRDAMRARGVPPGAAEAVAVPAAAQVACGPVVAALSGTVSIVAVPANLLAVPAIAPATVLGVAAAAVSPVWPAAAEALAWLAGWPARWLVAVARYGADLPAGALPWPGGACGGLLLAVITVAALVAGRRPLVHRLAAVVAVAVAIGSLPVRLLATGWPPAGWVFVACAVGQGDALVLPAGRGTAVVVDAGPEPAATDRCLRRLGVGRVAVLVLSHFHADHVGGTAGVFRGRTVGAVVTGGWPEPATGRAIVTRAAAAARTPVGAVGAGWTYAAGDLRLVVLAPVHPVRGTRSDPNNNSLVVRATVGGVDVLLTGDAEGEQQRTMLEAAPAGTLRSPVLKLAHHGSGYQDPGFLDAVDPALVVVSVGADNRYGHPNRALLARLTRDGARVLRTDLSGDVAAVRTADGLAAVARGHDPGTGPQ